MDRSYWSIVHDRCDSRFCTEPAVTASEPASEVPGLTVCTDSVRERGDRLSRTACTPLSPAMDRCCGSTADDRCDRRFCTEPPVTAVSHADSRCLGSLSA
ncbi:hypothetical protein GDO81_003642 [Engystomops pustulosus]|uniref:Uncharacterized protein n=1 Tax=Engystomops pustulosus TaxID=76066 RepID=A0AAV6ZY42_ENGPU|nr:hypothetical protein GDO81_003642 [Engystomops pustulosus]